MQRVKNVLGEFLRSKQLRTTMMVAMAMVITCVSAFAADGDPATASSIESAFQSGFSSFVSDAKSMIGMIITVALPLACTLFLARKAMSWFKSIAK